jgi:hypothetical protein
MAHGSSAALIEYLEEEFPGAKVSESTKDAEEWSLMRCFRVDDGRNSHLLVVSTVLLGNRSRGQLRELLDDTNVADVLFRARGLPVLLTETGPSVVG